jgi:hypothetical protein
VAEGSVKHRASVIREKVEMQRVVLARCSCGWQEYVADPGVAARIAMEHEEEKNAQATERR